MYRAVRGGRVTRSVDAVNKEEHGREIDEVCCYSRGGEGEK